MTRIKDPIELYKGRIERIAESYIDENTCMGCKKKVDYSLICSSPIGDGPELCVECLGYDPFEHEDK